MVIRRFLHSLLFALMPHTPPLANLYRLHIFQTVARRLSFTGAAEALHTSQPNISKHVRLLEAELGAALFDRLGGGVSLTDAGRIVFDYAEKLLETADDMRRALNELQGLGRGYLRLGASSTPGIYILPRLLAGFRKQYPGLEVTFRLGNSREIVQELSNDQIDLGFVGGFENTPRIQVQPFMDDELVLIAPEDHVFARAGAIAPQELAGETLIWREAGSGTRGEMVTLLGELGLRPESGLEISGCKGVKKAVAAGLGLSVVSRRAVEMELAAGALAIIQGEAFHLSRRLHIVTRKDRRPSVAGLAFLADLRKQAAG